MLDELLRFPIELCFIIASSSGVTVGFQMFIELGGDAEYAAAYRSDIALVTGRSIATGRLSDAAEAAFSDVAHDALEAVVGGDLTIWW